MKIYNGWILKIGGHDFVVMGSMKLRGSQTYILKAVANGDKTAIKRDKLLSGLSDKSIAYIGNYSD